MNDNRFNRQKSLKRRFLLVLGIAAFLCFLGLGLMIIFWDGINLQMTKTWRWIFGCVIIVYACLRFSRLLRNDTDE